MKPLARYPVPIQVHATGPIYVLTSPHAHGAPAAHQAGQRAAAFSKRLQTVLLAALALVSLLTFFEPRSGQGTVMDSLGRKAAGLWGAAPDPRTLASVNLDFPIQSCCVGQHCLTQDSGRHAIVTYLHSDKQVKELQELERSVRRSNGWADLAVMVVRGELGPDALEAVSEMDVTLLYVEPVFIRGRRNSQGWIKIRAFGLTQYDAVVLADTNAVVRSDLLPALALPAAYAAAGDAQAPWAAAMQPAALGKALRALGAAGAAGGRLQLVRPCGQLEAHMVDALSKDAAPGAPPRTAPSAPDDFLTWYFGPADAALAFDTYVINLDTAPDRLARFQGQLNQSDLAPHGYTRWPATDARVLPEIGQVVTQRAVEEIEAGEALGYRTMHYQLTRGSLGCYMSHLQLLQHVLASGREYAVIFEDDAVLEQDFLASLVELRPFPADWDVILLGWYCYSCSPLPGDRRFKVVEGFFGTHAYLVNRRGLKKILAYKGLMPIEKQIDAVLSDMTASGALQIYALSAQLAVQDRDMETTIQIPVKRSAGQLIGLGKDPYLRE